MWNPPGHQHNIHIPGTTVPIAYAYSEANRPPPRDIPLTAEQERELAAARERAIAAAKIELIRRAEWKARISQLIQSDDATAAVCRVVRAVMKSGITDFEAVGTNGPGGHLPMERYTDGKGPGRISVDRVCEEFNLRLPSPQEFAAWFASVAISPTSLVPTGERRTMLGLGGYETLYTRAWIFESGLIRWEHPSGIKAMAISPSGDLLWRFYHVMSGGAGDYRIDSGSKSELTYQSYAAMADQCDLPELPHFSSVDAGRDAPNGVPDRRTQILQARHISDLPVYERLENRDDEAWWEAVLSILKTGPPSPCKPCTVTVRSRNPPGAPGSSRYTQHKLVDVSFSDTEMWETKFVDTPGWPSFSPGGRSERSLGITAGGTMYLISDNLLGVPAVAPTSWRTAEVMYAVRGRPQLRLLAGEVDVRHQSRSWTVDGGARQMQVIGRSNELLVGVLTEWGRV